MKKRLSLVIILIVLLSMLLGACNSQPVATPVPTEVAVEPTEEVFVEEEPPYEYTCPERYQYLEDFWVDLGEYGVFRPYCYKGKFPKLDFTPPVLEGSLDTPPSEWVLDYTSPNIVKRGTKNIYELVESGGEISFNMPRAGSISKWITGDKSKVFVSDVQWEWAGDGIFFNPDNEKFLINEGTNVRIVVPPANFPSANWYDWYSRDRDPVAMRRSFVYTLPVVEFEANIIDPRNMYVEVELELGDPLYGEVYLNELTYVKTQSFDDGYGPREKLSFLSFRKVGNSGENLLETGGYIRFIMPSEGWLEYPKGVDVQGIHNHLAFYASGWAYKNMGTGGILPGHWVAAGEEIVYHFPPGTEQLELEVIFFRQ